MSHLVPSWSHSQFRSLLPQIRVSWTGLSPIVLLPPLSRKSNYLHRLTRTQEFRRVKRSSRQLLRCDVGGPHPYHFTMLQRVPRAQCRRGLNANQQNMNSMTQRTSRGRLLAGPYVDTVLASSAQRYGHRQPRPSTMLGALGEVLAQMPKSPRTVIVARRFRAHWVGWATSETHSTVGWSYHRL